jgi:predicted PurR-regulated permease PerM
MTGMLVAGFFDQGFFKGLLTIAIAVCWAFALYDLATRHFSGRQKAVWLVLILIFPVVGAIVYLLARPSTPVVAPYALEDVTQQPGHINDPRSQIQHTGI